jgi:hypothetical protein
LATDAQRNADIYGFFGISVFVEVEEFSLIQISATKLARFERLTIFFASDLLQRGLELWPAGKSPHYDVVHSSKNELVRLLMECPSTSVNNVYFGR